MIQPIADMSAQKEKVAAKSEMAALDSLHDCLQDVIDSLLDLVNECADEQDRIAMRWSELAELFGAAANR